MTRKEKKKKKEKNLAFCTTDLVGVCLMTV